MTTRTRERLILAVAVAVLLLLPRLTRLVTAPYDSWTHIFFASHYLHEWFTSMDMRWYLGFPIVSYPPLAHQLIAIVSWPFLQLGWDQVRALTISYTILSIGLTCLYPLAIYRYGRVFVSKRAASYGALVASIFSGWWVLLLAYGQFTTLMAGVFTLFGGSILYTALRTGETRHVVMAALLTALVLMTHHFTVISFLPAIYLIVIVSYVTNHPVTVEKSWSSLKSTILENGQPAILVGTLSGMFALGAIFPFVEFFLTSPEQPIIPHGSRQSWLEGTVWLRPQFFMTLTSGTLFILLAPVCAYVTYQKRNTPVLVAIGLSVIFGVLSLGFTTPLPRMLYPGIGEVLTYFRFGAWGGFILAPVIGLVITELYEGEFDISLIDRRPDNPSLILTFVLLLLLSQVVIASQATIFGAASPDRRADAREIGEFMESDEHWKWRYLTLGMTQELGLVAIEAPHAQTIDGNYNTGRQKERVPVLAQSKAAQLSSAKFSSIGRRVLSHYLAHHREYGIKFIFSTDRGYSRQLRANGYVILYEWSWLDVRVWYDQDVPPAQSTKTSPAQGGGWPMYLWGTIPLLTLLVLGLTTYWEFFTISITTTRDWITKAMR